MDIEEQICKDLMISNDFIKNALNNSRKQVKKFYIDKKNGGTRVILQPSSKLKTIQYWLINRVFSSMQTHDASAAYTRNKSILWNANQHRHSKYFLKIDFNNFFPSITWSDLQPLLEKWHEQNTPEWEFSDNAQSLIRLSCFYSNDRLPIGYPSSPTISNIVMNQTDEKIAQLLSDEEKYGNAVFTRYADDIVISTNKRNICDKIYSDISELIDSVSSPQLTINRKKTRMGSRASGSAYVTGLRICEGHITIHKKQKNHIRLLLNLHRKNKLSDKEQLSLLGHLSYVRHVAPAFYTKLQKNYFKEIAMLLKANRHRQ